MTFIGQDIFGHRVCAVMGSNGSVILRCDVEDEGYVGDDCVDDECSNISTISLDPKSAQMFAAWLRTELYTVRSAKK